MRERLEELYILNHLMGDEELWVLNVKGDKSLDEVRWGWTSEGCYRMKGGTHLGAATQDILLSHNTV